MRPILLAALVPCIACGASEGPSERDLDRADVLVEQALAEQDRGRTLDAVLLLGEALDLAPDHEQAHRLRAVLAERASKSAEVIESAYWLVENVEDELERADALARIARAALLDGDLVETRRAIQRLEDLEPDVSRTEVLWARYFLERGDIGQAERHARRAVKLQPQQTVAHHVIGLARESNGALEEAIECFRTVLRFDPGHLGARDHLATLLLRTDRGDEAAEHRAIHSAIVDATPGGFRHFVPDRRIASFENLVAMLPDWQLGRMELARAFLDAGRLAEARASADAALALDPASPDANALMALVLERQGDAQGARRHRELSRLTGADVADGDRDPDPSTRQ